MKRLVLVSMVVLFVMVSSFLMKVSSQEDIGVVKYVNNGGIQYIEIGASGNTEEIIVEALDAEKEIIHYAVLSNPAQKIDGDGNRRNYFYIPKSRGDLNSFTKLLIYPPNSNSKKYSMSELETIDITNEDVGGAEAVKMKELKVMSYNIHHGKNILGRDTLDIIAALIEESGADIIGLQEVDNGMYRSKFRNQLKYLADSLSMYYAYGENLNILSGRYGNAILSKYPIVYSENILLPSKREQRGMLRADIDVDGRKINFMSTHLGLNIEEREKQMKVITDYTKTLTDEIIIVGDFNAQPEEDEIRRFSKFMIDTGYAAGESHQPTFDFPFVSGRIDYIFISPSFTLNEYRVIKSRASDHYPVEALLTLP